MALRAAALCFFCFNPFVSANPYPADDLSLLEGAENFERYCTECHGWDPADQFTSLYPETPEEKQQEAQLIAELIAAVEGPQQEKKVVAPEDESWPEWAGPPPEKTLTEMEALEAAVIEDFNRAVDEVYGTTTSMYGWDDEDDSYHYEDRDDFDEESGVLFIDSKENRDAAATDLLDPLSYTNGTESEELYYNIAYGTGSTMPGFLDVLGSEEAVWDLVNYIQSLWVEEEPEELVVDAESPPGEGGSSP